MNLVIFGTIFLVSVSAMFFILLRRLYRLRALSFSEIEGVVEVVGVRLYVVKWLDYLEAWYKGKAKEQFLKLLDYALRLFEKGAGRVAGETKHVRMMVQERFRVIPRESLYWKHINTWKKTNGNSNGAHKNKSDHEGDISNHV